MMRIGIGLAAMLLAAGGGLAQWQPPERAATVAALLVDAEQADAQRSREGRRQLARAVTALDRLGARTDDPEGQAVLAAWRTKASGDIVPARGRVLGPAFRRGQLDPGGALTVDQLFLAGQSASVAVAATPGQSVDLAVSGPDSPRVCAGRSCRWTPIYTQRFSITVRNTGTARARYYLVMD